MRQVLFIVLFLMPIFSSASIWDEEILLYDDGTVKVEIQFRLRDSTCELSTSNKYRFIVKGLRTYTAYYEAMFEFEDCQGLDPAARGLLPLHASFAVRKRSCLR